MEAEIGLARGCLFSLDELLLVTADVQTAVVFNIVNDAALNQCPSCFVNSLNADGLHSKALRSLYIENVVIEKKHLLRSAAERLSHVLKGVGVRFDSPGQMRHEVVVEGGAES